MNTKLTLSVDKQVIDRAKLYAQKTGRSLSELVSAYFESLIYDEEKSRKISPKIKKLLGSVKLPNDFDEENERRSYLEKKHS